MLNKNVKSSDICYPFPKGAEGCLESQAKILRDGLERNYGIQLNDADAKDAMALVFFGECWESAVNNAQSDPYVSSNGGYYLDVKGSGILFANRLRTILGDQGASIDGNVFSILPRERYDTARSHEGALIASVLAFRPSTRLNIEALSIMSNVNSLGAPIKDQYTIYDQRSDTACFPLYFSSDPFTNEEYLRALTLAENRYILIPTKDVRFTRFAPNESDRGGEQYSLMTNCNSKSDADRYYDKAFSPATARHWFCGGNSLSILLFVKGEANQTMINHGLGTFDEQMSALACCFDDLKIVYLPAGLSVPPVKSHPSESFARLKKMLPHIQDEDAAFRSILKSPMPSSYRDHGKVVKAIDRYNSALSLALTALWEDTKEFNSRALLDELFGKGEAYSSLLFSDNEIFSPVARIKQIIGMTS